MVNHCANPKCVKPLHYLREGRVFLFNVAGARLGPDGKQIQHLEHYWLCGDCAPSMLVECGPDSTVSVRPRAASPQAEHADQRRAAALAS